MRYYIDTEFLEGTQNKTFLGMNVGKTKPTIDLVSIGIVSEGDKTLEQMPEPYFAGQNSDQRADAIKRIIGREYYAISKDFNLKEAWNRWQQRTGEGDRNNIEPRLYWLRENVLKPIYKELHDKECLYARQALHRANVYIPEPEFNFTYRNLKKLINKYGKTNKQIAEEIKEFCLKNKFVENKYGSVMVENPDKKGKPMYGFFEWDKPEFYAYYADYDWVVFCQLFGKMIDLPKGFPMFCKDLKQSFDEKQEFLQSSYKVGDLKKFSEYPKQTNEHNALADARWNKKLHEFLNNL